MVGLCGMSTGFPVEIPPMHARNHSIHKQTDVHSSVSVHVLELHMSLHMSDNIYQSMCIAIAACLQGLWLFLILLLNIATYPYLGMAFGLMLASSFL